MFWEYKCDPSGELLSFIKKICSVVTHSRYVKRLLAPVFLKIARNPFSHGVCRRWADVRCGDG